MARGKSSKKSSKKRTRRSAASIAKSVVRRELRKNVEMKRHFVNSTEDTVSTLSQGTNWYDLAAIDQGVKAQERIGMEVMAKGIHLAGHLHNNGSTTNWVRMVVIQQHTQDDISSLSEVFMKGGNTADFSSTTGMQAMYFPLQKTDFKVLYHQVFKLNPAGTAGLLDESRMFRKFIKLNKKISFQKDLSEGTDLQRPRYWLGCWAAESPDDTGLGETIELSFLSRFYFTDM